MIPTRASRLTCARSSPASSMAASSTSSRRATAPRWSGFCAHLRLSGRHHRQQRHPVQRVGAQRARTSSSCATSARSRWCSCRTSPASWWAASTKRHRPQRRQDGHGRATRGAQVHHHHRRQLRRRATTACAAARTAPLPVDVAQRISVMGGDADTPRGAGPGRHAQRADRRHQVNCSGCNPARARTWSIMDAVAHFTQLARC